MRLLGRFGRRPVRDGASLRWYYPDQVARSVTTGRSPSQPGFPKLPLVYSLMFLA